MRDKLSSHRRVWSQAVVVFIVGLSSMAMAGTLHPARHADRGEACWSADYAANQRANTQNTCYRACKIQDCKQSGGQWVCQATSANHEGSCRKSGYTTPVSPAKFRPRPGTPPPSLSPGRIVRTWQPKVPTSNHATLILENIGDTAATIWIKVTVRDTGYDHLPRSVKAEGPITLNPKQKYSEQFHQWRAADWDIEYR